jgi:hypothetical protein
MNDKSSTTISVAISEMDKRRKKRPPELQIHAAATLIMHGDPFALNEMERKDLAGEVAQFCVPIEAKWVGNLKKKHLDQAFESLKVNVYLKLREHGVMAAGE